MQTPAGRLTRLLQNTSDSIASNSCTVFYYHFPKFSLLIHQDALDYCLSLPDFFQLLPIFQFWHPSRSLGPIVAPRCISSFTNSDTIVLHLLACLSLSVTSVVFSQPQFSWVNLCSRRLVPPSQSRFLAAPPMTVAPATALSGESSTRPGMGSNGTPAASRRCDSSYRLRISSDSSDKIAISIRSRHSRHWVCHSPFTSCVAPDTSICVPVQL